MKNPPLPVHVISPVTQLASVRLVLKYPLTKKFLHWCQIPLVALFTAGLFCALAQTAGAVTLAPTPIGSCSGLVNQTGADSFTIVGTGNDVTINNGVDDNAYFASMSWMTGDVEIVARLVSFAYPANRSQAGLMMRKSLAAGEVNRAATFYWSGFAYGSEPPTNQLAFTGWGPPLAGNAYFYSHWNTINKGVNPPYWLKLVRVGNNYGTYWSLDGRDWNLLTGGCGGALFGTGAMNVGLFVSSGGSGTSATAVFDNVYIGVPRLKFKTSWVGSTSGGMADDAPANNIFALWVNGATDDGTCYTTGNWCESGYACKAYKDGKVAFDIPLGGGLFEGTITGNTHNLFFASNALKVYRTDFNGTNAVEVAFPTPTPFPSPWPGPGLTPPTATPTPFPIEVGGLAANDTLLFVSERRTNTVRIVDLTMNPPTQTAVATTAGIINHPGPIAYDGANFWIIDCASPFPLNCYVAPVTGATPPYTPAVKCFSPAGGYLGRDITDVSNPTALAKHPTQDRLYVCDNGPSQNIRYYTGLGVAGNHTVAGTFGQDKGLWQTGVGTHPGQITDSAFGGDARFYGPTGIGFDSLGNVYVACDGTNGNGTDLRKFTSTGALVWKQFGLEFVDCGDFDPGSDTIYTAEERFNMNYANTAPGSEWSYTAFTGNPFQANDLRNDPAGKPHGVLIRRLAGNNVFMYTNGMGGPPCMFYRFNNQDGSPGSPGTQGTTAIPYGSILAFNGGLKLWIDTNADGLVTTTAPSEETTIPSTLGYSLGGYWSYDVDSQGSLWLVFPGTLPEAIVQVPCTGTQMIGSATPQVKVPAYNLAGSKTFLCPAPLKVLASIKYDQANDVMYCVGMNENNKWMLARYDNWQATPTSDEHAARYVTLLPDFTSDLTVLAPPNAPDYFRVYTGMGFAGDKIFIADIWGPVRVYDANLGNPVITLNPGPELSATSAWEDMKMGLNAFKRSNGEYLILEENDGWHSSIPLFRWTPTADASTTTAPTALTATSAGNKIVLAWTGPTGLVTSYKIYRSTSSGTETLYQSGIMASTFTDLNVTAGVTYYYKVTAVNAAGESAQSNEASALPTNSGAEYVKTDTTTQGTWTTTSGKIYGTEGYEICNYLTSYPSYATVTTTPSPTYLGTWAASTTNVKGLLKDPTGVSTDRIAAFRSPAFFTVDPLSWNVDVGTGWRQVAVYMLDWDGDRHDHQVKIYDNTNGAPGNLLDTRRITDFSQGLYLVWNIRGKVRIEISEFANPQNTTVASGIFFDPVKVPAPTKAWWKLDETSGTVAADSSGAGNTGYKPSGSWNSGGKINGCVSFTGATSAGLLALPSTVFNLTPETLSLWFKTSVSGVLVAQGTSSTHYMPNLYVGTDGRLHGAFYTGGVATMMGAASVNDNAWHHAALTSDGLIQSLYLDGGVVGTLVAPVSYLNGPELGWWGPITGGWTALSGAAYFNGLVDDVRLYKRVLSNSEIWKLAQ